ncbi:hypothetical protein NKI32_31435, partial [Mesorhizobium sp. M0761]|uniref:hypothetical protein n=1 Tax=Mesorhizobium sp. M0761 TaxID=2956994 RepID=UPI0033350F05
HRACDRTPLAGVGCLSPLSDGRPLLWRATRQIVASLIATILIATIFPQPSLAALRHNLHALRYRWREPPRKRKFQSMPKLS